MNHWQSIAQLLRRSLITLALALLALLALYLGTVMLRDQVQNQLMQQQQDESALQGSLATQRADLSSLQSSTGRFNQLRPQGLLGVADREGWVEQLVASGQRVGLPESALTYTMLPPKALTQSGASPTSAGAVSGAVPATGPLTYDLELELKSSHEAEVLALLQDYRAHVKGLFMVESCSLENRTESGLLVRCTLRFFNLPDGPPAPAAPTAQ